MKEDRPWKISLGNQVRNTSFDTSITSAGNRTAATIWMKLIQLRKDLPEWPNARTPVDSHRGSNPSNDQTFESSRAA